jgi:hypothetical protein
LLIVKWQGAWIVMPSREVAMSHHDLTCLLLN